MTPFGGPRLLSAIRTHGEMRAWTLCALMLSLLILFPVSVARAATDAPADRMVVEADEMIYNQDKNTVSASGNVHVLYKGKVLEADRVTYDQHTQQIFAEGHAKLTEVDGSVVRAQRFELTDAADRPIKTYSGGMRRRLDLAASLIVKPKVLFLDEPTTGLDPRGRQDMWGVINELVKGGVTLLLTTQYLEEADHLADEIAVIDHGKVIARGTSDSLKKQVGGERLEIVVENQFVAATKEIVAKVSGGAINVDEGLRQISAPVTTGSKALIEAAKLLDEKGIHPLDIGLKRPSLDDVFLSLTGHVAEEKKDEDLASSGKKRGR